MKENIGPVLSIESLKGDKQIAEYRAQRDPVLLMQA